MAAKCSQAGRRIRLASSGHGKGGCAHQPCRRTRHHPIHAEPLRGKCEPQDLESLRRSLTQLTRNTRELQESVMQIRMLPMSFSFNRFPRLVHDLSRKLGKKVELKFSGESTELDKTVLEKIGDPLVHLVRNALDHGLESPEQRAAPARAKPARSNSMLSTREAASSSRSKMTVPDSTSIAFWKKRVSAASSSRVRRYPMSRFSTWFSSPASPPRISSVMSRGAEWAWT